MTFSESVYQAVSRIPKGKVCSYGTIALLIGSPRASRQVGWALHANPYFGVVPCHRVVFKDGSLAKGFVFGGEGVQRAMLESEGVAFGEDGRVRTECFLAPDLLSQCPPSLAEEREETSSK